MRWTLLYEIHRLITYIWNKEGLPQQWKEPIIVHTYKNAIKLTVVITEEYHFYNYIQNFIHHSSIKDNCIPTCRQSTENCCVDFDVKDQLLIRFSEFFGHWRENGSTLSKSKSHYDRRPVRQSVLVSGSHDRILISVRHLR
jgi:hypothetical protein